jgi:hypothetical protein
MGKGLVARTDWQPISDFQEDKSVRISHETIYQTF